MNMATLLQEAIDAMDAATWREVDGPVDPQKLRTCRAYLGTSGEWTYMVVVLDANDTSPAEAAATAAKGGTSIRLPLAMSMKARELAEKR